MTDVKGILEDWQKQGIGFVPVRAFPTCTASPDRGDPHTR